MDFGAKERTPRKQYMGKRSEEKSYENRRSSADTWDRSFISNLYRNSVKITGVRELSKPQNPVLVVKEKGNYQSLKSRNKVSTFLKIGLPSTCCSQSVEFAANETDKGRDNMIYTGMRLPQIGSERNTSEERINQNEDPNKKYDNDDERSVGFFNKVTRNSDEQAYMNNCKQPEKVSQPSRLPKIQRGTRKQNNRAFEREVLILATSRPNFDADSANMGKWPNELSSPIGFTGHAILSNFQVGVKGSYQLQRNRMIYAHNSVRDSLVENEIVNDTRMSMLRGRELHSTEFPYEREEINQSMNNEGAPLSDDLLMRTTPRKVLKKKQPIYTRKIESPMQHRKIHHSASEIEENSSVEKKSNQTNGFRGENGQQSLTSALISDKVYETRNSSNHPRHKANQMSMNSNIQVISDIHQNINHRTVWSRENTDREFGTTSKVSKNTSQNSKKVYTQIAAIAKANDKTTVRVSSQFERGAPENQKYLVFLDYLYKVSFSFGVVCRSPTHQMTYKYFIGKGNNSSLVRSLLKARWWWTPVDSIDSPEVHLVWTQLRNNSVIESLKSKKTVLKLQDEGIISRDTLTSNFEHASSNDSECGNNTLKLSSEKRKSRKQTDDEKDKDPALHLSKILTKNEINTYKNFTSVSKKNLLNSHDIEILAKSCKKVNMSVYDPSQLKTHNRMENNYHLSNKKKLYYNMKAYYESIKDDVFNYLPKTFHITKGTQDEKYTKFSEYFNEREKCSKEIEKQYNEADQNGKKELAEKRIRNIWIIKPGENTNRGKGIRVVSELTEIQQIINSKEKHPNGNEKTYLIQQYLDRPLLYNKRKFDIRCYMMILSVNGHMKGYWYQDGYIRTCSKEFTLKNLGNRMIHLTNDAVQKNSEEYGKFENGNKISYGEFQRYIDTAFSGANVNFFTDIYPQMRNMARDSIRAVYGKIDPNRCEHTFEVFGLDFMIDQNFKPWLIEINTNPCLELSAPLLARLIPAMLENAFRLAIDPFFPPPIPLGNKKSHFPENLLESNKFELIFDEAEDGPWLRNLSSPNDEAAAAQILELEDEIELDDDGVL